MLYLSTLLIEEKEIETFVELLNIIKQKARDVEMFIRIDLKPPFPDTPDDWEDKIESTFSSYIK